MRNNTLLQRAWLLLWRSGIAWCITFMIAIAVTGLCHAQPESLCACTGNPPHCPLELGLVPCSPDCDRDDDGDVDENDLEDFLLDSEHCAPTDDVELHWEDLTVFFLDTGGGCTTCSDFKITLDGITTIWIRKFGKPPSKGFTDLLEVLLTPPPLILPVDPDLPDDQPEDGDEDEDGGGKGPGEGDEDDPGPGEGEMPEPPGGGGDSPGGNSAGGPNGGSNGSSGRGGGWPSLLATTCPTVELQNPKSGNPVRLFEGAKIEEVVDLSIPMPGRDFELRRYYSGGENIRQFGLVANGWTLSAFSRLFHPSIPNLPGSPVPDLETLHVVGRDGFTTHVYTLNHENDRFESTTGSPLYIEPSLRTWNETIYAVYKLVDPGKTTAYYHRYPGVGDTGATTSLGANVYGRLWQEVDTYGHVWTFVYDIEPATEFAYLGEIRLDDSESGDPKALVQFGWNWVDDEEDIPVGGMYGSNGRLSYVQAHRLIGETWDPIAYAAYNRTPRTASVGSVGDLVLVWHGHRVDHNFTASEFATGWAIAPTLYRYHTGQEPPNPAPEDERLAVVGELSQLRSVILPEQVEHLAALLCEEDDVTYPPADALRLAAELLLASNDEDIVAGPDPGGLTVTDLLAKIVGYDESGRVLVQYVQTGCGCAGAPHGLKEAYEYVTYSDPDVSSTVMREYALDDEGEYQLFRSTYTDMQKLLKIPYMVNRVIEDTDNKRWAWHYEYDEVARRVIREFHPSAMDSYTPGDNVAEPNVLPEYVAKTDGGLVYQYDYDDAGNRNSIAVRSADGTTFDLMQETVFSIDEFEEELGRTDLVITLRKYRVAGSTLDDDVEVTSYEYGVYDDDPQHGIAWVKAIAEAELEAESGPGGNYESYTLYDRDGNVFWTRDATNSLTFRKHDPVTGLPLKIVYNASRASPDGVFADSLDDEFDTLDTTTWGRYYSGGKDLVETGIYDSQGRVKQWTGTNGVTRFHLYDVAPLPSKPDGIGYLRNVVLPQEMTEGGFVGPASLSWQNAGGRGLLSTAWLITADTYDPLAYDFELDEEVARSSSEYALTGAKLSSRVWYDVSANLSYTTSYSYDSLGRVSSVHSPSGTITFNAAHDVFDRVLEVKTGVSPDVGEAKTVVEYFYDSDGTDVQGVGDGNLTLSRSHVDSVTVRETERVFDHRNRVQWVIPDEPPFEYFEYDNLDRPIARSVFSALPTGSPDATEADRGLYERTFYSQRGLVYRTARKHDPTDLSSNTNNVIGTWRWFDAEGRAIKEWMPSSPTVNRVYDGLLERVTYDPYGRAQHRWPGDFNGDGYADSTDTGGMALFYPIDDPGYRADEDLDRNGYTDIDDLIIAASVWSGRGPLGSGQISDPEGPANRVGFAGYRFEPSSSLYHVRFRWYDTGLGRWAERDPAGYVDGSSLYSYVQSTPLRWVDTHGLCKVEVRYNKLTPLYSHAYVVVTDKRGKEHYFRGGPSADGPSSGNSGAVTSGGGGSSGGASSGGSGSGSSNSTSPGCGDAHGRSKGPWGPITTEYGDYTEGTIDWNPDSPSSDTVLDDDAPCDELLKKLQNGADDINNSGVPYNPFGPNSNSTARELLEGVGLTPPDPSEYVPGWTTPIESGREYQARLRLEDEAHRRQKRESERRSGGGYVCFTAGTMIRLSNGEFVDIATLEEGATLLAFRTRDSTIQSVTVSRFFRAQSTELYRIALEAETLEVTAEHPFLVHERGWVMARDLKSVHSLVTIDGDCAKVLRVEHVILDHPVDVFALSVSAPNTYAVGRTGVVVHNK